MNKNRLEPLSLIPQPACVPAIGDSRAMFSPTPPTLLFRVSVSDPASRAHGDLVGYYYKPMLGYARSLGIPEPEAEDLVQQFLAVKVPHDDQRDACRGLRQVAMEYQAKHGAVRFRAMLCEALKLFLIDQYFRKLKGQQRQRFESLDADGVPDATWSDRAEAGFARDCLVQALEEAKAALRPRYERKSRPITFDQLLPYIARHRNDAGTQRALAEALVMPEGSLNALIHRWRGYLREALRACIARSLPNPEGVDAELRELQRLAALADEPAPAVWIPNPDAGPNLNTTRRLGADES